MHSRSPQDGLLAVDDFRRLEGFFFFTEVHFWSDLLCNRKGLFVLAEVWMRKQLDQQGWQKEQERHAEEGGITTEVHCHWQCSVLHFEERCVGESPSYSFWSSFTRLQQGIGIMCLALSTGLLLNSHFYWWEIGVLFSVHLRVCWYTGSTELGRVVRFKMNFKLEF